MRAPSRRHALLLAAALPTGLLGACAALRPPVAADATLIAGRLSLQVEAAGSEPPRAFSGRFELRGDAHAGLLELSGPLGAMVARAQWSGGRYQLDDGQRVREFATLDDLASGALGEPLPLAALFDWLRLRPWPGAAHAPLPQGRAGFEQLGWIVDLQDAPAGLLRAQRTAPPVLNLRVRLETEAST